MFAGLEDSTKSKACGDNFRMNNVVNDHVLNTCKLRHMQIIGKMEWLDNDATLVEFDID